MCPHAWCNVLPNASVVTSWTLARFNQTLRRVLIELGIPRDQTLQYCSHDFRRGCAKDLLQHAGPVATDGALRMGIA